MEPTLRLFDADSHTFTFTATVLSCQPTDMPEQYAVILDRTAFFPEGGGQAADPGTLEGLSVSDVQVSSDGIITHTVAGVLPPGRIVTGQLDTETRLRRMQCHSGEHILSGLIHARYGFRNVGFHLGDEEVTLDFDGVLNRGQLDDIEDQANRLVRACLPVKAWYPTPEELATLSYRSKLALTEHVRLVRIGPDGDAVDLCACCAPHVANTGEIGLIKMLDVTHYKGGIRIRMLAGAMALEDYRRRYAIVTALAADMSVRQTDVLEGYARHKRALEEKNQTVACLRRELWEAQVSTLSATQGSLCLFGEGLDALSMRQLLNRTSSRCGLLCGIFSGCDADGYTYCIGRGSSDINLKQYAGEIQTALSARGGGSPEMLQGRCSASRAVIEAWFSAWKPTV